MAKRSWRCSWGPRKGELEAEERAEDRFIREAEGSEVVALLGKGGGRRCCC